MSYYLPFAPSIRLGQQFGWNPGLGPNPAGGHNGDDWLTPVGTPVRAAGNGVVVFAGEFDSTYEDNWGWNLHYGGKMVVLNMDGDTAPYFEYGHNSQILVKAGQRVVAGQVIAITGNTDGGTNVSTGPHCHVGCLPWNFNLGSNTYGRINPRLWMTKHWDGGDIALASSGSTTPNTPSSQEDFMATLNEDEKRRLLAAADRLNGVVTHPTNAILTTGHLEAIGDAVLKRDLPWFGFDGAVPVEGRRTTTVETLAGWHDNGTAQLQAAVAGLTELVKQLSVAQGVTIDYAAIAKAVNDDAAARMKG